jgi:hypothetical protein
MQPDICDDAAGGPADIVTTCAYHRFESGFDALTADQAIPICASTDASLFNGSWRFITALGRATLGLFRQLLVVEKPAVC